VTGWGWLALIGWIGWAVTAIAWWRARQGVVPVDPATEPVPLVAAPDTDDLVAVLMTKAGVVESYRRIRKGEPPERLYRPHGKDRPLVTYRFQRRDGQRALYRSET
jgi:hypothetical protein